MTRLLGFEGASKPGSPVQASLLAACAASLDGAA